MEVIVTTLVDQLKVIANSGASKYINTGEKGIDTALQIISSTLVGGFLSLLIHLFMKGGWKKLKMWCKRNNNTLKHIVFDFETDKIKDYSECNYICLLKNKQYFKDWYDKVHTSHNLVVSKGLLLYVNDSGLTSNNGLTLYASSTSSFPCWKGNDGYIVFYNPYNLYLYSDSQVAIRECLEDIRKVQNEKDENEKKEQEKTVINNNLYTTIITDKTVDYYGLGTYDRRTLFSTLFFEQKGMYMKVLESFKNKTLYPKHLPMENKLGILLHGPPGTGKTRLIAATANYLNYHIVMVDMSKIKTKTQFSELLKTSIGKNWVLVLEEIDCVKGILSRELEKETTMSSNVVTDGMNPYMMMLMSEKEKSNDLVEMYKHERSMSSDALDLGYILTKLDGLESNEGRILIATTNHPERIDPALLRPGRLGLKICLSYATRFMMRDILCMVYNIEDEHEREKVFQKLNGIPENKFTPAVILQEAILHPTLDTMIEFLM